MVPSCVGDCARVSSLTPTPRARAIFAIPKSSTLTPDFVTSTFAGFKSRCVMPLRCAASMAPANWMASASALIERHRAFEG